jgi:hypothetical protein
MTNIIKPLTPSLRRDIRIGVDQQIADLQTCKPNAFVNAQIEALRTFKRLINGLPDGYPIPLRKSNSN